MSVIVNSFGQKFAEAAQPSRQRRYQRSATKDLDELISAWDHSAIVTASRNLYQNNGIVRGAIDQKSAYSTTGFLPQFLGPDKDWGNLATEYLSRWYGVADVRGTDFIMDLFLISVSIDRDGDVAILLTETENKYPQIQLIPAHRIGQRDTKTRLTEGAYAGLKISKGVVKNKWGRPVAYLILGDTEEEDTFVSARNLLLSYDPQWVDQSRGMPLFAHAINSFRDMHEANEREQAAMLLLSSIAFLEYNEEGADPTQDNVSGEPSTYDLESGSIKFIASNSGGKIQEVAHNRPSANYREFHNRLSSAALVGTGWPEQLAGMDSSNGTVSRIALLQARKAISDRQSILKGLCKKIISFVIGRAIDTGALPPTKAFWDWDFSTENRLSIDLGRDSTSLLKMYEAGLINLTDILAEEGKTVENHIRQREEEKALAQIIAKEVREKHNLPENDPV